MDGNFGKRALRDLESVADSVADSVTESVTESVAARPSLAPWLMALAGACVILLVMFLASPWPAIPLAGRLDEAVYALGGADWARGHMPYRDFWDNKPPSIYLINAVAWRLGGGLTGIWIISAANNIAATLLFFSISRHWFGRAASWWASAFFFGAMLPFDSPNVVNAFVVTLNLLSLAVLLVCLRRGGGFVPAGGAMGLAWAFTLMLRPNAVLFQTALLGFLNLAAWRRRPPYLAVLAAQIAGALLYLAPLLLYFRRHHALSAAADCLLRFNAVYISGPPLAHAKALLWGLPLAAGGNPVLLICGVAAALWRPSRQPIAELRWLERCLPALLAGELILGAAAGRPYGDYFEPAILVAGFLAGALAAAVLDHVPSSAAGGWRAAALAAFAGMLAPAFLWCAQADGAVFGAKGFWFNQPVSGIAAYLRVHPGNERIFVWGNHPGAYLLPGIAPFQEKYSFILPFLTPHYVDAALVDGLLHDIGQNPPLFIFDLSPSDDEVPPLAGAAPPFMAPFYEYVAANYVIADRMAGFIVYRRVFGR